MGSKYYKQTVEIVFDREGDVYKRIAEVAKQTGESFGSIVNFVVVAGLAHHMNVNLKHYYEEKLKSTEVDTTE